MSSSIPIVRCDFRCKQAGNSTRCATFERHERTTKYERFVVVHMVPYDMLPHRHRYPEMV
eukprot:scaffold104316_cov34-Prasinocladus_malaysianus.AAC.1